MNLKLTWTREGWMFKNETKTSKPIPNLKLRLNVDEEFRRFFEGWTDEEYYDVNRWFLGKEVPNCWLTLDPNIFTLMFEKTRKWIVKDETLTKIVFLTGISAYSTNPINLFLKGPSSIGKSWIPTKALTFFPEEDVWFLGGLSPTALVHDYGYWDEKQKKYVVELQGKILVFLEAPHPDTFARLRPILSHDKWEIQYKFTSKTRKGQLKTETVHLRGWPATIWATTSEKWLEEMVTRSLTATPEVSPDKFRKAIKRSGKEYAYPWFFQNPSDLTEYKTVMEDFSRILPKYHVVLPYGEVLGEIYPATFSRDMRDFNKLISLIQQHTMLHLFYRPRIEEKLYNEKMLVLATLKDFDEALKLFRAVVETTRLGISETLLKFFQEIICPIYEKYRKVESGEEPLEPDKSLTQIVPTYDNIIKVMIERYGSARSRVTIKGWIQTLAEVGLVDEQEDPTDKRRKMVVVLRKPEDEFKALEKKLHQLFKPEKLEKWFEKLPSNVKITLGCEWLGNLKEVDKEDFLFKYYQEWV